MRTVAAEIVQKWGAEHRGKAVRARFLKMLTLLDTWEGDEVLI